jgi:RNA polymerase sigma-70 factor (ECF subfamily)
MIFHMKSSGILPDGTARAPSSSALSKRVVESLSRLTMKGTTANQMNAKIVLAPPPATLEDSALIALALAGQTECFAALIDRHRVPVQKRIASMVRNAADVDDVLQETLLKVWRHLSTFRSESSFRTWMTRVAINEAMQSYRREQHRPLCQALGKLDVVDSKAESPHQSFVRVELSQAVRSAVARLRAKDKQVLILRDLQQLSERDAAHCLNLSVPAVKTRLFRARLVLRAEFQRSSNSGLPSAGRSRRAGVDKERLCSTLANTPC